MEITKVKLSGKYAAKIPIREALYMEREPLAAQTASLKHIGEKSYQKLHDELLAHHLSFDDAFALICHVLRASNAELERRFYDVLEPIPELNKVVAARETLVAFAMKEGWAELTPDEIAGMVAATMLDVMCYADYPPQIVEISGMGGDHGIIVNGETLKRKTVNISTLVALTLAALGVPTAKHGSYGNTSQVGSTDAIEALGVVVDIPSAEVQHTLARSGFHFTDAHAWKTIHDLSHLEPRRETVNHVIGPMTAPIGPETRLIKVLGVNEKVHPENIARAYEKLAERGIFRVGNVAVICGLSEKITQGVMGVHAKFREHVVLDELSPIASAVAFVARGRYANTHLLTPADFGVKFRDPFAPYIKNDRDVIMAANQSVLAGHDDDRQLIDLVAMNAALALYLATAADDDHELVERGPSRDALQDCFKRCLKTIHDGKVGSFLESLVAKTRELNRPFAT